jgi:hypothetical protein
MNDIDGKVIKLSDEIRLSGSDEGIVVADLDGGEFLAKYPEGEWGYLQEGVMVLSDQIGLVHLTKKNVVLENIRVKK